MPRAGGVRLRLRLQLRLQHRLALGLALIVSAGGVFALPSPRPGAQKALHLRPLGPEPKLHGRFLHITDFHPDELYRVRASTEEDIACHRGKGLAGSYGAEKTDCDTPFALVNATFRWVGEHLRDSVDFVVWTGDSARHDSDEENPRHEPEILRTNRLIADQFAATFASPENNNLAIPVVPTFGNNDFLPHNIMFPGPNRWFQAYSDIWKRFVPEEQRHSFAFGGWFSVEVIPNRLAVFSLNTMYFFDRNAGVDGCAHPSEPGYKHLEWLRVQLQILRGRGMKAILVGHVPPARTESKQLWDETCWQKYTLWMKQYRDVVTGALYGHMNIDHFLLQDTEDLTPSLGADAFHARASLEEAVSIESKEDYLHELREKWSNLPRSVVRELDDDEAREEGLNKRTGKKEGKNHHGKHGNIGGKHAERYQLSLISPSVVPNYFPSLRVIEYNITGLENAAVWQDSFDATAASSTSPTWPAGEEEDDGQAETDAAMNKDKKQNKGKEGSGRKPPRDRDLIIPKDPPEDSLPGPAYYPQPFTFTGYTQYYANLTHINNDLLDEEVEGSKWRKGKHDHRKPKHGKPKPRTFEYQVEYSTFDDETYRLSDLTVKSYLKLAYRMRQKRKNKEEALDVCEDDGNDEGDEGLALHRSGNKKRGGSKKAKDQHNKQGKKTTKSRKEKNKVWLRFLSHAFVSTVPKEELEKL